MAPENFTHFAELFTAAVLQAAATGEALLDEELGNLAKQNVSKFQRLNQRLQVLTLPCQKSALLRPEAGNAVESCSFCKMIDVFTLQQDLLGRSNSTSCYFTEPVCSQAPGLRTAADKKPHSPTSSRPGQNHPASSGPSISRRISSGKNAGSTPGATSSAKAVAAEFAPALRFYVLILEAADSHRLNSNLLR